MTPKEAETPAVEEPPKLTPYQGKRKCFGLFECSKCNREWASGHSWANISQACRACHTKVYPKHQRRLRRRKKRKSLGGDPSKAHAVELCGQCQRLGYTCVNFDRKEQTSEIPRNHASKKKEEKEKIKTQRREERGFRRVAVPKV